MSHKATEDDNKSVTCNEVSVHAPKKKTNLDEENSTPSQEICKEYRFGFEEQSEKVNLVG